MTALWLLGIAALTLLFTWYGVSAWWPSLFPARTQRSLWVVGTPAIMAPGVLMFWSGGIFVALLELFGDSWTFEHDLVAELLFASFVTGLLLAGSLGLLRRPRFLLPPHVRDPSRQHVVKTLDARGRGRLRRPVSAESIREALEESKKASGSVLAGSRHVKLAGDWRRGGGFRVHWGTGGLTTHLATWQEPVDLDAVSDDLLGLLNAGSDPRTALTVR